MKAYFIKGKLPNEKSWTTLGESDSVGALKSIKDEWIEEYKSEGIEIKVGRNEKVLQSVPQPA